MVDLIRDLRAEQVRANLEQARARIAAAGRDPSEVQVLAAVKYVPVEELGALAEAGVQLLGENRAQDLAIKAEAYPGRFTWDFIGHLQSRKVRQVLPHVRYIHSVATDSVLAQLQRHAAPETEILVEVNVAGESSKSGIDPAGLPSFLARSPVTVAGLMTMPPLARDPEDSRPYFAALRELAQRYGLEHLSMGTSQDYLVAVQEGATIVRLGAILYAQRRDEGPAGGDTGSRVTAKASPAGR
jgi:pyridoxal phosphate enzyme (YggS family)